MNPATDAMEVTLSGNELALAELSVQLAMDWWKCRPPSDFQREQLANLGALNRKLAAIASARRTARFQTPSQP